METDQRRDAFVIAALELFSEKGFARTSIHDITERVGVTRSLFYHYFADKQAITDAANELRVDEFMDYIRDWTRGLGGTANAQDSLLTLAHIVRTYLTNPESLGSCIIREQNASLYQRFVVRSATLIAQHFVKTRGERGALIHLTHTRHPEESFYVLAVGIMSIMYRRPEVSDEVIADLMADTLHIDLDQKIGFEDVRSQSDV